MIQAFAPLAIPKTPIIHHHKSAAHHRFPPTTILLSGPLKNGEKVAEEKSTISTSLNAKQLETQLQNCQSGTAAKRILEANLLTKDDNNNNNKAPLYNSISIPPDSSTKGLSDGDLAIMTRIKNTKYSIMDLIELNGDRDADRASLAVLAIFVGSTISALVANQNLPGPQILRFLVVWIFSFAPLAFVGYGIAAPDLLQALLVQIQSTVFPNYRQRMIQHEAGHFLLGHLLGFPIQTYQTNAVKNAVTFYPLNDPEVGLDRARMLGFDKNYNVESDRDDIEQQQQESTPSFFSDEGRGSQILNQQSVFRKEDNQKRNYTQFLQVDSINEPSNSWPYRGFDEATIDKLSVVSVAGVCAEILAFGNAEGGLADFNQLKQLFQSMEQRDSSNNNEPMTDREAENRVRFALGYTMSQLRRHLGALDALANVMERDGSIAECVMAIESCENVSGNDGILIQDYEIQRKEQFRQNDNLILSLIEQIFLGEPKTANVVEDRYVEGKGGGYKKERKFVLTGDDPFYLALGVAGVFLLWASSGGLSLH